MPSKDYGADILKFAQSIANADDTPLFSAFSEWDREEVLFFTSALFGMASFLFVGGFIVVAIFEECYGATVKACSWVCKPWTRISELEQREKVIERWEKVIEQREKTVDLKETLITRQAQNLSLDVEIGVCKCLLEILRHDMKSMEEKTSALEKEKASLFLKHIYAIIGVSTKLCEVPLHNSATVAGSEPRLGLPGSVMTACKSQGVYAQMEEIRLTPYFLNSSKLITMNPLYNLTEISNTLRNALPTEAPPLDLSSIPTCCCRQDDCENYKAWKNIKSLLEHKITLSVDTGQALLGCLEELNQQRKCEEWNPPAVVEESQVTELIKEKQALEKQLSQALVQNEITETSSELVHQELQDARQTIARLQVANAHYVNVDSRLSEVSNELDDLRQERNVESAKTKRIQKELVAVQKSAAKLRSQVSQLQLELREKILHQTEFKGTLLQGTKSHIQRLYAKLNSTRASESIELTNSLEAACTCNEELRQHIKELEDFLADARDEINTLRQDVEEQDPDIPIPMKDREYDGLLQDTTNEGSKAEGEEGEGEVSEGKYTSDVRTGSDPELHYRPQRSLTSLLHDVVLRFFFLIGMVTYWIFCAKAIWITVMNEEKQLDVIELVLSSSISIVSLLRVAEAGTHRTLYEAVLVNTTSFLGAFLDVYIGWQVMYEIRTALALASMDFVIGLLVDVISYVIDTLSGMKDSFESKSISYGVRPSAYAYWNLLEMRSNGSYPTQIHLVVIPDPGMDDSDNIPE
ncbi:hypothetical protein EV360DRAFT_66951 [Lentinula raphanica]|nr:hypothetical protein EV360DRAFT_66951 [Lentinula raphanica]